jgi:hypothetical protein
MKKHIVRFDDVVDYADKAKNGETSCRADRRQSRENTASESWDYGTGFDESISIARTGWEYGRKRIEELAYKFRDDVLRGNDDTFMAPKFTRSFVGGSVNVGRYVAGMPDAMIARKRIEIESPVINIMCNVSASAVIGSETYFIRGAALAALIDLLELSGRRVRLTTVFCTSSKNDSAGIYITVKRPGDPLQMDAVAFALAHPAYMRRLGFSILEQFDYKVRESIGIGDAGHRYGKPTDVEFDGDVYMPKISSGEHWSNERAEKWVREHLLRIGVLREEEAA